MLAKFSFPSPSMLIWKTFMPKPTRETREESHTYIHETTKFLFVFSGSVSTNYDRDCSHSANRSYKRQTVLLTWILGLEPCKLYLCCHLVCPLSVLMSLSLLPSFQFFSQEKHPGLSLQTSTRGTRTTITKRQINPLVDPFPPLRGLYEGKNLPS